MGVSPCWLLAHPKGKLSLACLGTSSPAPSLWGGPTSEICPLSLLEQRFSTFLTP